MLQNNLQAAVTAAIGLCGAPHWQTTNSTFQAANAAAGGWDGLQAAGMRHQHKGLAVPFQLEHRQCQ